MSDHTSMKRCSKCGNEFPATTEYFHKKCSKRPGLRSVCIACHREDLRRKYADNPDKWKFGADNAQAVLAAIAEYFEKVR